MTFHAFRRSPTRHRVVALLTALVLLAPVVAHVDGAGAAEPEPAPDPDVVGELPEGHDLPEAFLDGEPVGDEEIDPEPADDDGRAGEGDDDEGPADGPAGTERQMAPMAAPAARYIGEGPWLTIRFISAGVAKPCRVGSEELAAMVFAPIFKESSAATSPSSVGSPMTLSRADEWTSGVRGTGNNLDANHGLYENRNPDTPYQRAYWHPGIGLWQYDSAGVGAPFTAAGRIDTAVVGLDVVRGMLNRYCASSATDDFGKRRSAWSPWLSACTTSVVADNLCEQEYRNMIGTTPVFANVRPVAGVSATGGMLERTCRVGGVSHTCWYVDPDRAEGTRSWQFNPSGGPDWRTRPTPLSHPFYVLERNGQEERHWIRADTGYAVDISARRLLGRNARPRSGTANAGSGLTWSRSSDLCDLTTGRGRCGQVPDPDPPMPDQGAVPAGVTRSQVSVKGSHYQPIALDLNGSGRSDIFWYGPGAAKDALWISNGTARFRSGPAQNVNGVYEPIVLDANGDGLDDLLWYTPGGVRQRLWLSRGDGTFTPQNYDVDARSIPIVLDRDGDGSDEVLWYGPGAAPDLWWEWKGGKYVATTTSVSGTYTPLVGDFDGNGVEDIFWYGPGAAKDSLWLFDRQGRRTIVPVNVNGVYEPVVGDFDGDGRDDIVWYAPGPGADSIWFMGPGARSYNSQRFTVNSRYRPLVVDLGRDGRVDLLWYDEIGGAETLWTRWAANRDRTSSSVPMPPKLEPVVGRWSNTARGAGILWYGGTVPSFLWWI